MKLKHLCAVAALGFASFSAYAFPIAAPGTEGAKVIASGGTVTARYEGNSAAYSNDLILQLAGPDLFVFNNHANTPGDTAVLGSFTAGTELIFQLYVNNTGLTYYTGPASRNPDGLAHARVQTNWQPGRTLVSFEDLFGAPEGIYGYNDLSFSFDNTVGSVPDTGATFGLLGMSLVGLALIRRK